VHVGAELVDHVVRERLDEEVRAVLDLRDGCGDVVGDANLDAHCAGCSSTGVGCGSTGSVTVSGASASSGSPSYSSTRRSAGARRQHLHSHELGHWADVIEPARLAVVALDGLQLRGPEANAPRDAIVELARQAHLFVNLVVGQIGHPRCTSIRIAESDVLQESARLIDCTSNVVASTTSRSDGRMSVPDGTVAV
jgi:hypothetical protein